MTMKRARAGGRKAKPASLRGKPRRDASFIAFVSEQLSSLGGVRAKSMFGGHGFYARDLFFAVADEGRLYFKVDDGTRPRYESRGMGPFTPAPSMVMKGYYEVPLDVLEDAAELTRWAREACEVARKAAGMKGRTPSRPSRAPRGRGPS